MTALLIILTIAASICGLAAGGEPQRVLVRPGLVELRLPELPEGADVTWEAREPLTLDYRSYEGGSVLVTHLTSGQAVLVSDVIDWQAKRRDRTTWIVVVQPGPQPPSPPVPVPGPTVPSGIAADVYRAAESIKQPAIARRFADAFRTASAEIGAGRWQTLVEVKTRIVALCTGIAPGSSAWQAVGAMIEQQLAAVTTPAQAKGIFDQVVTGLDAAGAK